MQQIITKLIGYLIAFKEEKDRKKKYILAKQISNICSANFKQATKKNQNLAQLIHPLIALGYFQIDSNKFDPNQKELDKIIIGLLKMGNN